MPLLCFRLRRGDTRTVSTERGDIVSAGRRLYSFRELRPEDLETTPSTIHITACQR